MLLELLIVFLLHGNSEADIIPLDRTYIVKKVNEDVFIPWTYDYENDMFNVGWSFKNSSSTTVILTKVLQNPAQVHNNFNVQHDGNGNITLKKVTTENEGIYYCKVVYTGASARITVTGTATLSIDTGTTTTNSPTTTFSTTNTVYSSDTTAAFNNTTINITNTATTDSFNSTPTTSDSVAFPWIGVYIGVPVLVVIVIFIIVCVCLRKKREKKKKQVRMDDNLDTKVTSL